MSTIGQNIKYYRLCAGWTQDELAKRANLHIVTIRRYEEEISEQSVKTTKAIANALNVPLAELLDETKSFPKTKLYVTTRARKKRVRPETKNFTYLNIDKINKARYAKGLTHKQLAELAGVSKTTIANAMLGKRISVDTAEKIERAVLDD